MDVVTAEEVLKVFNSSQIEISQQSKPITVEKHIEVNIDQGDLLLVDTNDLNKKQLGGNKDQYLLNLTRDNVQLLFNQIWKLPTERLDEAIVARLPPRRTILPRFKPVPKPRPLTKWQEFAKAKGITKKKKSKLTWDEQLSRWVPTFGYRRDKAEKERDWVLEVPKNADPMEDQFAKRSEAKGERVAKNELQRLRNIAKARNVKVPRMGVVNPETSTAKDLHVAMTVAKSSTASLGKFQPKLPREVEARGVAAITPGASRKRKLQPVPAENEKRHNLEIVESVLNKRPKLEVNKAVARHINEEQVERSEEKRKKGGKAGKAGKPGKASKKPKGGKGARKGKASGRKRR